MSLAYSFTMTDHWLSDSIVTGHRLGESALTDMLTRYRHVIRNVDLASSRHQIGNPFSPHHRLCDST
ncbi:hypothetical protein Q3G72_011217 [Acer saccharum]|nr:hypothetical protein Q3G72_011217 [Acer saccharum]